MMSHNVMNVQVDRENWLETELVWKAPSLPNSFETICEPWEGRCVGEHTPPLPDPLEGDSGDSQIESAKHLLLNLEYRIDEIAEHLGYASADEFERIFCQAAGRSASDYREGLQALTQVCACSNFLPAPKLMRESCLIADRLARAL